MVSRFCAVVLLLWTSALASEEEQKLLTKLFENYDTRIRPVQKDSDTLVVEVGLTLQKLIKLCPKSDTFEVNAWIVQKWNDHQLKWDPAQHGGISRLFVPQSDIFKPDLVLFNSAKGLIEEQKLQPNKAVIQPDGKTLIVDSVKLAVNCFTNTTVTETNCSIMLGSWVYDLSRIDLKLDVFDMNVEGVANKYWTVQGIDGTRVEHVSPKYSEKYVFININVNMAKNLDANDSEKMNGNDEHHKSGRKAPRSISG